MPLLALEPRKTVIHAWFKRHEHDKARVATCIDAKTFDMIRQNGTAFNTFAYPVYRPKALAVLFGQFQAPKHVIMTGLEAYNRQRDAANPCFVLTFYDDFSKSKDLVLVRGDITDPVISKKEAEDLLFLFLRLHTEPGLIQHLRTFNDRPDTFEYDAVFQALRPVK